MLEISLDGTKWFLGKFQGKFGRRRKKKRETLSTLVLKDKDGSLGSEINIIRKEINDLLDSEEIMWH